MIIKKLFHSLPSFLADCNRKYKKFFFRPNRLRVFGGCQVVERRGQETLRTGSRTSAPATQDRPPRVQVPAAPPQARQGRHLRWHDRARWSWRRRADRVSRGTDARRRGRHGATGARLPQKTVPYPHQHRTSTARRLHHTQPTRVCSETFFVN